MLGNAIITLLEDQQESQIKMSHTALALTSVVLLGFFIPIAAIVLSRLLGGRYEASGNKLLPYESGIIQTVGSAEERFSIKFYLIAILFIIFDVEVVFMYPWAVNFTLLGLAGFLEMMVFLAILLAGYVYIWKKGALTWD